MHEQTPHMGLNRCFGGYSRGSSGLEPKVAIINNGLVSDVEVSAADWIELFLQYRRAVCRKHTPVTQG